MGADEAQRGVPVAGALLVLLVHLTLAPLAAFVLLQPLVSNFLDDGDVPLRGAVRGLISSVAGLLTLGALWLVARRWPAPRHALALVRGRLTWWVAAPAVLGLAVVSDVVSALAGRPMVPTQFVPYFSGWADTVLMSVAVVLVGPVVEELVYRGALYGAVETRSSAHAALLVTTAVFAVAHIGTYGGDLVALGQVAALGGLLTWLRFVSGSLVPSVVGHVVANAYATALLLLTR